MAAEAEAPPAAGAHASQPPLPPQQQLTQQQQQQLLQALAGAGAAPVRAQAGAATIGAVAAVLARSQDDKELADLLLSWAADDLALLQMPTSTELGPLAASDAPLLPGMM